MIKKFENKTYLKNDNKSQNKIYVVYNKNAVYQSLYVAVCLLFFWSFLKATHFIIKKIKTCNTFSQRYIDR